MSGGNQIFLDAAHRLWVQREAVFLVAFLDILQRPKAAVLVEVLYLHAGNLSAPRSGLKEYRQNGAIAQA